MRSSPANASLTCVPMDAICTSGAATSPMKKMYMTKSPSVMEPPTIDRPPTMIMSDADHADDHGRGGADGRRPGDGCRHVL